jgi:hypothetical protein
MLLPIFSVNRRCLPFSLIDFQRRELRPIISGSRKKKKEESRKIGKLLIEKGIRRPERKRSSERKRSLEMKRPERFLDKIRPLGTLFLLDLFLKRVPIFRMTVLLFLTAAVPFRFAADSQRKRRDDNEESSIPKDKAEWRNLLHNLKDRYFLERPSKQG